VTSTTFIRCSTWCLPGSNRDLHDIHTVLHTVSAWEQLPESAKGYAAHRMWLLYIAITKGWSAALFYDQQGEDEFLDLAPRLLAPVPAPNLYGPAVSTACVEGCATEGTGKATATRCEMTQQSPPVYTGSTQGNTIKSHLNVIIIILC
jgi:hypothetical protein